MVAAAGAVVEVLVGVEGRRDQIRAECQNKRRREATLARSVLGGRAGIDFRPEPTMKTPSRLAARTSMQTVIRGTLLCACSPLAVLVFVAAYITPVCSAALPSPRWPSKISIFSVAIRPSQTSETPLFVYLRYHLRILVSARRLYVPHGLPAAPCPCPPTHAS